MKKVIIYVLILIFPILLKAQWKSIPLGTTFYYSGFSYKNKLSGYTKGGRSVYDTLWKKPIPVFCLRLDTIIHLSGSARKLILFSGCINSLFLYYKRYIMLGDMDNLPDNWNNEKMLEKEKATILYQNNTEYYTLTVSEDFASKYLHNAAMIKQLDDTILAKNVVANDSINSTFNYLSYRNIRLPIISFINTDQEITRQRQFPYNFHIYMKTSKEEYNHLFKSIDWYEYEIAYGDSKIGINNKYGIVESKYEIEAKPNSNESYIEGTIIQLKYVK